MKVYLFPADLHGCGFYRMIFAGNVLLAHGHDVTMVPPYNRDAITGTKDENGRLIRVTAPQDADVMVLQRVTYGPLVEAISIWRAAGIAVVVDMDDDLSCIPASNPAGRALAQLGGEHSWDTAERACAAASLVTVSTPALTERYGAHGRAIVLPNCVPGVFMQIPRKDSEVFGYGGALAIHREDLPMVGPEVARLMREGHKFCVVGPKNEVKKALGLPWEPLSTGKVDIRDWASSLADNLGVGMAPLANNKFNRAKSWLKLLEMSSLGIPAVVSDRIEYARLNAEGCGVLADGSGDWYRKLKKLITDERWRQELSESSRHAASKWTVEGNAWRWYEAWSAAVRIERMAKRPAGLRAVAVPDGQALSSS